MSPQSSTARPVSDLFDAPLPRGLREQTAGMSWDAIVTVFGHNAGPVRLGQWECSDAGRTSARLTAQARIYQATIAVGDRISTSSATASGPVAALTAMLHELGVSIELLKFHQLRSGQHTATFIQGSDGVRAEWAMGWAPDATQSSLRAVIACVNRLRD